MYDLDCDKEILRWRHRLFMTGRWLALFVAFPCFFAGCGSKSSSEKPRTNYEIDDRPAVADSSHPDGDHEHQAESNVTLVDSDAWKEDIDAPDAVNRLIAYASTLRSRRSQVNKQQQQVDRVSLVEIGDELEKRGLDGLQKTAAFQMKSQSLMELVDAGNEEFRPRLVDLIDSYRDDSNPDFARSAQFLELNLAIGDYFRDGANDFSKPQEIFVNVAKAHPEDIEVVETITGLLSELVARGQRDPVVSVMREIAGVYAQSDNEHVRRISGIFEDRIFLVESKFDQIATDTAKGVDGAIEKYQEGIRTLARRQGSGEFYRETVSAVQMLEQQGLFKDARELYDLLKQTYESHSDPKIVAQMERDVERGIQRLDLVGHPVKIIGSLVDGKAFDQSALENKVAVVFFWSSQFPTSARMMKSLLPIYHLYRDHGFEIVAVCVDENVDEAIGIFGGKNPPWITVFQNEKEPFMQMLDNLGIQKLPYTMLLDKQGNVADINVPLRELNNQILEMLDISDDQVPGNAAIGPGGLVLLFAALIEW